MIRKELQHTGEGVKAKIKKSWTRAYYTREKLRFLHSISPVKRRRMGVVEAPRLDIAPSGRAKCT